MKNSKRVTALENQIEKSEHNIIVIWDYTDGVYTIDDGRAMALEELEAENRDVIIVIWE